MDHAYIEVNSVADRYVMGGLPPSEREQFEEHFIDCEWCQQQIEASRGLRDGFRAIGDAEAAIPHPIAHSSWMRPMAWMAAGLLIAALPGGWFAARSLRLQQELDQERREIKLTQSREPRVAAVETPRSLPVYWLSLVRGAGAEAPSVTIPISERQQLVLLELENPQAPEFTDYQVVITDINNRPVLNETGFRQTTPEHLAIAIPCSSIPPGDYRLALSGRSREQHSVPVARFLFRTSRVN